MSQEIIKRHLQMVLFIKTFHTSSHIHAGESPCRLWRKYKEKVVEKMFCFIETIDYLTNVPTDSSLQRCHAKRTSRTDWLTNVWALYVHSMDALADCGTPPGRYELGEAQRHYWAQGTWTGTAWPDREKEGVGEEGGEVPTTPSFPSHRRPHPSRLRWSSGWWSGRAGGRSLFRQWLLVPASDRWWERAGG